MDTVLQPHFQGGRLCTFALLFRQTIHKKVFLVSLQFTRGHNYIHADLIKVSPWCRIVKHFHVTRETDSSLSLGEWHKG